MERIDAGNEETAAITKAQAMTIHRMHPTGLLVDFWSILQAVSISKPPSPTSVSSRARQRQCCRPPQNPTKQA
jgi:hypothetical protein